MYVEVENDFVRPANTSLHLNCSLTPADNVTWYHRGERISPDDEKYKLVDASLQMEVGEFEIHLCACAMFHIYDCRLGK